MRLTVAVAFFVLTIFRGGSPFHTSSFSKRAIQQNEQENAVNRKLVEAFLRVSRGESATAPSFQSSGLSQGYSNSDNPPFDLVTALQVISAHKFEFSFWDPVQQDIVVQRTVDLTTQNLINVAKDICKEYVKGELHNIDRTARYRCLVPTLLTLRFTKLHAISMIARQYEKLPYDEEIYGLLHGYDGLRSISGDGNVGDTQAAEVEELLLKDIDRDSKSHKEENASKDEQHETDDNRHTACIIGIPTAHTILPALFTNSINRILVFSSLFDFTEDDGMEQSTNPTDSSSDDIIVRNNQTIWNYYHANEVAQYLGKSIEYFGISELLERSNSATARTSDDRDMSILDEEVRSQCSVIQFNTGYSIEFGLSNNNNPKEVIEYLAYSDSDGHANARIIVLNWKSQHQTKVDTNNTLSSMVEELLADKTTASTPPLTSSVNNIERDFSMKVYFTSTWLANNYFIAQSSSCNVPKSSHNIPFKLCTIDAGSRSIISFFENGGTAGLSIIYMGQYQQSTTREYNKLPQIGKTIIVLTNSMNTFTENIFGLANGISSIQQDKQIEVYIATEMNWHIYEYLMTKAEKVIHIAISAVDITLFGRHSILYNSEQPFFSAIFGHGLARYQSLFLDNDIMIWSFDQRTTQYLQEIVFKYNNIDIVLEEAGQYILQHHILSKRIVTVPYMYSMNHKETLDDLFTVNTSIGIQDRITDNIRIHEHIPLFLHLRTSLSSYVHITDDGRSKQLFSNEQIASIYREEIESQSRHRMVVYMGSSYNRRGVITAELERLFLQSHWKGLLPKEVKFYNFCDQFVYGYYRDYYLRKAKIIINLASSSKISVLETHRINYLLSLGKVIVSEYGADMELANRYRPAVIFVEDDPHAVIGDDEHEEMMKERGRKIFAIVAELMLNETWLEEKSAVARNFYQDIILEDSKMELTNALNETSFNFYR